MEADQKKTALRMIPYGLYVLTGQTVDGRTAAATVNWVTQASFEPPLVVVGVKVDSGPHRIIKEAGAFCLNILGKDQAAIAHTFFKPAERVGQTIGGEPYRAGRAGAPVLSSCRAHLECELIESVERGDHAVFVGRVIDAGVAKMGAGRPDAETLTLVDLGERIFYGG